MRYTRSCVQAVRNEMAETGLFFFRKMRKFHVHTADETIDYILRNKVSVSRYGDGELNMIVHRGNGFQHPDDRLSLRLEALLHVQMPRHIVCMPYVFEDMSYLTPEAAGFWRGQIGLHFRRLLKTIPAREYYDTNFTRFYMDHKDKSDRAAMVEKIRRLWDGRDICIVEGAGTRMGIGNDLISNARSVRRIIGPSVDAFSSYPQLLGSIRRLVPRNMLVLCALGMTATVLAYDLHKIGYWAIDIGHLDIEYEWFKKGVEHKVPIDNKSVNELDRNLGGDIDDELYHSQIIYRADGL